LQGLYDAGRQNRSVANIFMNECAFKGPHKRHVLFQRPSHISGFCYVDFLWVSSISTSQQMHV